MTGRSHVRIERPDPDLITRDGANELLGDALRAYATVCRYHLPTSRRRVSLRRLALLAGRQGEVDAAIRQLDRRYHPTAARPPPA